MKIVVISLALLLMSSPIYAAPGAERTIAAGKTLVIDSLKDPESARFRNVRVVRGSVCGEVNAKNSMGGYVGFSRFYVAAGLVANIDSGSMSDDLWSMFCAPKPPAHAKTAEPAPYHEKSWDELK